MNYGQQILSAGNFGSVGPFGGQVVVGNAGYQIPSGAYNRGLSYSNPTPLRSLPAGEYFAVGADATTFLQDNKFFILGGGLALAGIVALMMTKR